MTLHKMPGTSIGVDVGGTKIAAGLVDAQGLIHNRVRRPTPVGSPEKILRGVADAVEEVISSSGLQRISGSLIYVEETTVDEPT